jgi:amino acid permease
MSVTIIVKSTIGAGIISLPYTINKLGYILSIIAFVVFFALNQYCTVLLLKSKNLSRHSNFSTILYYIWHSDGSKIFGSALIFVDNLGTCILEFILIKSSIRNIAREVSGDPNITDNFYCSEWFIVVVVGLILFPLVLIKKIERLRVFSFIGVGGVIVFAVAIIVLYIAKRIDGFPGMTMQPFPRDWFGAASAVANIIFAFNFQMNFFPIFKGLKDASDSKMEKACLVGLVGCAVPYLAVGFIGYSMAGDGSKANFL